MRIDRARGLMREEGLDAILATSYEGVGYLSGTTIMTQRSIPERLAAVILPLEGDPVLVVCAVEEAQVRRQSHIGDIRSYVEFSESATSVIADVLAELGLQRARVGVEEHSLPARRLAELQQHLTECGFGSGDRLFARLSMVKSDDEIRLLARAALATDEAIASAYGDAASTDKEVADQLAAGVQRGGADSVAFLVLGAGPTAAEAHPVAAGRRLESGDVVRCDVGGYFSGYYSDLARTAIVDRATPEQDDAYRRLWDIHDEVISHARAGIEARELFFICEKAFKKNGLQMSISHIGHGLGLGLHEEPIIHAHNTTVIEEGTVLALEPIHRDGGPIFHVEDLLAITADGPEVLSRSRDWSNLPLISMAAPAKGGGVSTPP